MDSTIKLTLHKDKSELEKQIGKPFKPRSSRGSHRQGLQMRMDIESKLEVPDKKPERLKDDILTLFDDDFPPSIKGVKDWIIEVHSSLNSYWNRKSKTDEILRKNLGFHDGMRYLMTILLAELTVDQGRELERRIVEDLGPLLATYCADCQNIIEDD